LPHPCESGILDLEELNVGIISVALSLSNPARPELRSVEVQAVVDTGAFALCIPEHVRIQLDLQEAERREVTMANGKKESVSYVGPVKIACLGRTSYAGAVVLGDRVLLGAIPLEDMDLVISPTKREITVNPQSPNVPSGIVM
jgi:clan AA aspartic protease